ncbi:uncharacterized protein F4822DRAFT_273690 [Hypoxylon trugodes]|uniref:uncharacterized protein n=1 Tax=Hypoxylon trugodes TaxID=326681 RepID=UPI0021995D6C|nr:uncharacterized protein F4822DRAFT_273690 [Hypoxylon trugodes]KAI1382498.1 hypothetical protein F4822DRAFT_273690 [Hypoxylon trugodes]
MRARILRFQGYFKEAYHILQTLPRDAGGVVLLLSAVLCELDRYEEAIQLLESRVTTVNDTARGGRTKLTLAHAYLFKCMHTWLHEGTIDRISLRISNNIYEDLIRQWRTDTYFETMDYLSIAMGLAVIQHLNDQVQPALNAWRRALATSMEWLPIGYTNLIIYHSMSELEIRKGGYVSADTLARQTRDLLSTTTRQHHFLGLGSIWPDIIGRWRAAYGQDPIVPPRYLGD